MTLPYFPVPSSAAVNQGYRMQGAEGDFQGKDGQSLLCKSVGHRRRRNVLGQESGEWENVLPIVSQNPRGLALTENGKAL